MTAVASEKAAISDVLSRWPHLDGATCWDVGVDNGETTELFAHLVGFHGRVVAIDADAVALAALRARIERQPRLTRCLETIEFAASDRTDSFTAPPMTKLDDLVADGLPAPAVLRIGPSVHALAVIRGARLLLANARPRVLVHARNATEASAAAELLHEAGYVTQVAEAGQAEARLLNAAHRSVTPGVARRLNKRILLCAAIAPPHESGHGVVLERMFRDIDPHDYCILSFRFPTKVRHELPRLPATLHEVATDWQPVWFVPGTERFTSFRSVRRFTAEVIRRARIISSTVRAERCGAIVVTTSPMGAPDVIAAWLASIRTHVPLVVYMLDEWQQMVAVDPGLRVPSALIGRIAIPRARQILVTNPMLGLDVLAKYGRRAAVISNPPEVEPSETLAVPSLPWPCSPGEVRIVFTGQISLAQADSIVRVAEAVASPKLENVSLHLYTPQAPAALLRFGMTAKVTVHPYVRPEAVQHVQREADILLLALSFASPLQDVIRTAAPTKLGEYVVSGRPILVHAPADSYIASIAREDGIGEVVGEPSIDELIEAILRIRDDSRHRGDTVVNAKQFALREFSTDATIGRFVATLNSLL
jgi:glycosyltransferase involved in cell wall biosynthesis